MESYTSAAARTDGRAGQPGPRRNALGNENKEEKFSNLNKNRLMCQQCVVCTDVTAAHSLNIVQCTHGAECISAAKHYHECPPLCGYARRASEKRRRAEVAKNSKSVKQAKKPKRHYRCKLSSEECPDMDCHYHAGRAAVYKKDCTMRNLEAMKDKDVKEAVELWEQLDDQPLLGLQTLPFQDECNLAAHDCALCSAQEYGCMCPASRFTLDINAPEFAPETEARPIYIEEEKYSPEFSTILEHGVSPEQSDEEYDDVNFSATDSSAPSEEEKKLASIPVTPSNTPAESIPGDHLGRLDDLYDNILDNALQMLEDSSAPVTTDVRDKDHLAPSAPELAALPDDSLRKEKYVVFSSHNVQGPRKHHGIFTKVMVAFGIASRREVTLENEEAGHVTGNVLTLAQKQIDVVKYFWQDWEGRPPVVTEDCISLFAGTFTHADYADIFTDLAKFVLTNPAFTKTQTKLLKEGRALRETVRLRVSQLIADHPQHRAYSLQQRVLSNTITFIDNQLLLRGLIDEARKPQQIAPAVVDFRKEAVSKTSLLPAQPSRFAARQPSLTRFTRSTAAFV